MKGRFSICTLVAVCAAVTLLTTNGWCGKTFTGGTGSEKRYPVKVKQIYRMNFEEPSGPYDYGHTTRYKLAVEDNKGGLWGLGNAGESFSNNEENDAAKSTWRPKFAPGAPTTSFPWAQGSPGTFLDELAWAANTDAVWDLWWWRTDQAWYVVHGSKNYPLNTHHIETYGKGAYRYY